MCFTNAPELMHRMNITRDKGVLELIVRVVKTLNSRVTEGTHFIRGRGLHLTTEEVVFVPSYSLNEINTVMLYSPLTFIFLYQKTEEGVQKSLSFWRTGESAIQCYSNTVRIPTVWLFFKKKFKIVYRCIIKTGKHQVPKDYSVLGTNASKGSTL